MIVHSFRDIYSSHVQVEKGQWNAVHQRMQLLEQQVKELTTELNTYKVKPQDVTAIPPVGEQQQSVENPEPITGTPKQRVKRVVNEPTR